MKKLFSLVAACLTVMSMNAGNFGMMIGGVYHAGTVNPSPKDPSFQEYMVLDVEVSNGTTLQLWDQDNNTGWAVNLDGSSVSGITRDGDHYNCTADGCYNFYIKIKQNNDQLYIGNGTCSSGGGTGEETADYGMMIGETYHAGTVNTNPTDPSFQEYMVLNIQVANGTTLQIYDNNKKQGWAVNLDGSSVSGITRDGDHYNCTADGCYNFYIKIKQNNDQLYIGNGTCSGSGSGEQGGQGGQGSSTSDHYYYWKGYIDGENLEGYMEGINDFVNGVSSFSCSQFSYVFVIYQKHGVLGDEYALENYAVLSDEPYHVTLKKAPSPFSKAGIAPGDYTFYLYDNENGTLELSTIELTGKKLVDSDLTGTEDIVYQLDQSAPMYDIIGKPVGQDYHGIVIQNGRKFIK